MSRVPIRVKLTLAFTVAMALVLLGAGALLVSRFDQRFEQSVATNLRLRANDLAGLVVESRRAGDPMPVGDAAGRRVQVLDLRNRLVAASADFAQRSVLSADELRAAATGELLLRRGGADGVLLFARPAGPNRVVVAGASLEPRTGARAALAHVLLAGSPAILLLAVLASYGVASFALRPVEAMRRRAEAVTATGSGQRLPVPAARDGIAALGRTLNAMIERLEQAVDRERTLVADASHELRTPLAIAQAEIDLALRPEASRGDARDALHSVAEEVQRLVRLCDDLLVLARADRRALRLDRRWIAVPELLQRVSERARRTYGEALVVAAGPAPGTEVEADPLRLEQALSNLVANASRYGASRVRLWSSADEGDGVRLHVTDDGPGFAEDLLPRAFSRFSRGADTPAGTGSGLGLAIVSAIADAHGGDAGARNVAPRGADVWIRLPRR